MRILEALQFVFLEKQGRTKPLMSLRFPFTKWRGVFFERNWRLHAEKLNDPISKLTLKTFVCRF